jgi:aspartate aminotransferase
MVKGPITKMNINTEFQAADRLDGIALSEIVQISERAAELRRQGVDVIALSTGEPDFPTPAHVVEAAHQAALAGQTRYTATAGTADLRAAVASQAGVGAEQVMISTGAKQVLANAFLATLNPGDEVIMAAPFWTSYADMVRLAGGVAVVLTCDAAQVFKLTPEQLEQAITPRTRWLLLNSPSNPSGAIYSEAELRALAAVLSRHPQVWVISDEIYQHLSYVAFTPFVHAVPDLTDRVLTVNGVSKAFSMTGWRIGWAIGPQPLIKAMTAVQGQVTSGTCSVAQAAALAAVTGPQDLLTDRLGELRARRDMMVDGLNAAGLACPVPDGAFYVFPKCPEKMPSDPEFCRYLLDTAGVAVVPGQAFGMPGHLRLSFAYGRESLQQGLARITGAVQAL